MMAKLVAVCRSDDYPYERRQIPLVIEDNFKMVVQFPDTCISCEQGGIRSKDFQKFTSKLSLLTKEEIHMALRVSRKEILSLLAQLVPCVGCRKSVERLFEELVENRYPALEPLVVESNHTICIHKDLIANQRSLYAMFYVYGDKLSSILEGIPKSKKNKRCVLHSLDTHKLRSMSNWKEVWSALSEECQEEVILVDCDSLRTTLDEYLRKHRFCSECKSKVERAYTFLVEELDTSGEKGYCAALYDGLRCCYEEGHIHLHRSSHFIASLIDRAEPELSGSRRERHAKTLDIAQEEVLTCLGVFLYDRLNRIWQRLRAEEQTWHILFSVGVHAIRKNFEVALETKQGISNLELTCNKFFEEEQAKLNKKQQKKLKKKRKKKENCQCPKVEEICSNDLTSAQSANENHGDNNSSVGNDCGYSSGNEDSESASIDDCATLALPTIVNKPCRDDISWKHKNSKQERLNGKKSAFTSKLRTVQLDSRGSNGLSLADMLEENGEVGSNAFISQEDIETFKAQNANNLDTQRKQLRATLRQRFADMQKTKWPISNSKTKLQD